MSPKRLCMFFKDLQHALNKKRTVTESFLHTWFKDKLEMKKDMMHQSEDSNYIEECVR